MDDTAVKNLIFVIASVLLLSACDENDDIDELRSNQQKWEALNEVEYEMSFRFSAFNPEAGEYRILVDNETVRTAYYVGTSFGIEAGYRDESHFIYEMATVSEMFKRAEDVIANAEKYTIEYHQDYGYPTLVSADYAEMVADDEVTYRITALKRSSDTACDASAAAGINLKLSLGSSEQANSCDAIVYIEDGEYVEQLTSCVDNTFAGAWERTGDYKITASLAGYETVTLENIVVYPFLCHVGARNVELTLTPN